MSFRRIIIAVDGSAFAARAANVGFELARSLGAEAALIHVIDPSVVVAPEGGGCSKKAPGPTGRKLHCGSSARR
jgi:hypothetical protein